MQEMAGTTIDTAALLSAATALHGQDTDIPALLDIGGEPVIAHQIRVLRHFGINRFFIEVDQVPGALLAISDKIRASGVTIEFVRSPQELAQKLPANAMLFAMAEGVVADPKLLTEIMGNTMPFIATVDGRDENSHFERMDLNTRWAGLARFNRSTIASVANLPEGWSIASSLLRQAMQQGTMQQALKQVQLQDRKLCLVAAPADADEMTAKLLSARAEKVGGAVELNIFGSLAKWLAPAIWRNEWAKKAVPVLSALTAAGSVALAWTGMDALSAITALFSIFGVSVLTTMSGREEGGILRLVTGPVVWTLLAGALGAALWELPATGFVDLFPAIMLVGLIIHARRLALPNWARSILASPALAALVVLLFAIFDQSAFGVRCLAVIYLITLIVARLKHKGVAADKTDLESNA